MKSVVPRGDAGVKREGASEDRIIANSFRLEQQSALSLPGSRRTPQARHRNWSNPGRQIHGKAQATTISRLEDFSPQPRRWDCILDLFVVPTLSFRLLYGLVILRHGRRQILGLGMAARPTAEWMARQLTEACARKCPPRYIVRDRPITARGSTMDKHALYKARIGGHALRPEYDPALSTANGESLSPCREKGRLAPSGILSRWRWCRKAKSERSDDEVPRGPHVI